MKKAKTTPQNDNLTDILKLLTKRVEDATADISDIKGIVAGTSLRVDSLKTDTTLIKSDVEKLRGEMDELRGEIKIAEKRIISEVGEFIDDRILPQLDDKADKKDVQRLEQKLDSLLHAN